jgi:hypothetical protein
LIFIFAGVVLRGRLTVVMNAVLMEDTKNIVKPRGNTAALPKGKKPTVNLKIAAGMV